MPLDAEKVVVQWVHVINQHREERLNRSKAESGELIWSEVLKRQSNTTEVYSTQYLFSSSTQPFATRQ